MNTITDSLYGTFSQYAPVNRTTAPTNLYAYSSEQSGIAANLQKLLTSLDEVDTALAGFQSAAGTSASTSANSQPTPATSTRIESTEDINSTASIVDPRKAFNGNGANSPNFETGISIREGSFLVNGVEITVVANSTIFSVLSTINASGANVTASYKAAEEKVVLTHNQLGAGSTIDLTDDSSGFLRATKLDSATIESGLDASLPKNTNIKPRSYKTADMLKNLNDTLAAVLEPSNYQGNTLKVAIQNVVADMLLDFGESRLKRIGIEFSDSDIQLFKQNDSTRRRQVHALQNGDRDILSALTGAKDGKQGLIPSLKDVIITHLGSAYSGYYTGSISNYRA